MILDFSRNQRRKTQKGDLVTGYECDPMTAEAICCKGRNRKAPTKQQGGQPIRSSLSGTAGKGAIAGIVNN